MSKQGNPDVCAEIVAIIHAHNDVINALSADEIKKDDNAIAAVITILSRLADEGAAITRLANQQGIEAKCDRRGRIAITPYATITYEEDGEVETIVFDYATLDEVFTKASEIECFADCSGVQNVQVHYDGHVYHYGGWLPDMCITWYKDNGSLAWTGYFPQWDH